MSAVETSSLCAKQKCDISCFWTPKVCFTIVSISLSVLTLCFNIHRIWPCTINVGSILAANRFFFPLQGLTLYPISLCPSTLSGMSVLFGIIFFFVEAYWWKTVEWAQKQTQTVINLKVRTGEGAGTEFRQILKLFLFQLGFCIQWAHTHCCN